jgi:hypothetical protein
MRKNHFIFVLVLFQISCFSQNLPESLNLEAVRFTSIFGFDKNDNSMRFCLIGHGVRTQFSDDTDSLISEWLLNHKSARIIPVSYFRDNRIDNPYSNMTYCWIMDNIDTLNLFLIRQGCIPGEAMQRYKRWKEMEKREKEFYRGLDKPKVRVFINKTDYKKFMDRIIVAEADAKLNKLGIWKVK